MDTLGLQAALVKLDPATTVTPIGTSVKILPRHHRPSYVDVDENDVTLQNKSPTTKPPPETQSRKVQTDTPITGIIISGCQSQQASQQISGSKSTIAEVR